MQCDVRKLSGVDVAQTFQINTSEQHKATDRVNLLLFLRPVSSDYADFIREFEQDG